MTKHWVDAAPPKRSKRQAQADLDYCISDPNEREKYRIIKRGSRWIIQYPRTTVVAYE